jgi:hypothetical protein
MKKIDIQITKGAIKGFAVEMADGLPQVTATVALFTEGGKEVTTYSISTHTYYGTNTFELPAQMIAPIKEITARLEAVLIHERNKSMHLQEVKPEALAETPIYGVPILKRENLEDYLGDGVYAVQNESRGVWLFANDSKEPTDSIFLKPEVYDALTRFWIKFKENQ